MSKYIELAKKLKALADRGIGGEKDNAKKMLNALMKKHGMTKVDVEGEDLCDNIITVTKEKDNLFHQICYHVIGRRYKNTSIKKYKNKILIVCTKAEALEIESKLDFYWKLYKEELAIFYHAFIQKNHLFANDVEATKPKEEDRERNRRIAEMANAIQKKTLHKLLT